MSGPFDPGPFEPAWADDPLSGDTWALDETWSSPSPMVEQDDHTASPFSVALATLAGVGVVRGLRGRWRRGREASDATTGAADGAPAEVAASPAPPVTSGPSAPCVVDGTAGAERAALVALCVELDDLLGRPAQRQRLRRGLQAVGVEVVDPVGERFDPEVHCAVGAEPTAEPADDWCIARVERVGFVDRGREVRPPEVVVFRADGGHGDG
jgi:hypothetical protein